MAGSSVAPKSRSMLVEPLAVADGPTGVNRVTALKKSTGFLSISSQETCVIRADPRPDEFEGKQEMLTEAGGSRLAEIRR